MLYYCDLTLFNRFLNIQGNAVILGGIILRLCAYMFAALGYKITLARRKLFKRPIVSAYIIFCGKPAVRVGRIGIYKLITLIYAVLSPRKRCISLCRALLGVCLYYG